MITRQQTLQNELHLHGVGIHTGQGANLRFVPAPTGHGIQFRRVDLPNAPAIEALAENVVEVSRSTTLGKGDVRVQTVEHVLAALSGMQVDNVLIEVDGPEVPILDGSSAKFTAAIRACGIVKQDVEREYAVLKETVTYEDPKRKVKLCARPSPHFQLDVRIDFETEVGFSQVAQLTRIDDFVSEISKSRTFCFFNEVEELLENNLIKGGDLDNAIVIMDQEVPQEEMERIGRLFNRPDIQIQKDGILNHIELHYANEPARHKVLDMVGDLTLVGKPLRAHIVAERPGHAANVELARKIRAQIMG